MPNRNVCVCGCVSMCVAAKQQGGLKLYLDFQRLSATWVAMGLLATRCIMHAKAAASSKMLLQQLMLMESLVFGVLHNVFFGCGISGAPGVHRLCFDLFWTWFAYCIRPPSRLLHDLAVAELCICNVLQLCS